MTHRSDGVASMTDSNAEDKLESLKLGRPDAEFPSGNFPTLFTDGILSGSQTKEVVKLYLGRNDSNVFGRGGAVINPIAQVVMPISSFIAAVVLMERMIDNMIDSKVISKEFVDKVKNRTKITSSTESDGGGNEQQN